MEFLLAERIPNLDLSPIRSTLDIVRWHGYYLANTGVWLVLIELVEDTAGRQGGLANRTIAHQDELVIKLTIVE